MAVCFSCECVEPPTWPETGQRVGIDVGLKTFATVSDEQEIANPRFFRAEERALAKAQRRTRSRSGSTRRGVNRWWGTRPGRPGRREGGVRGHSHLINRPPRSPQAVRPEDIMIASGASETMTRLTRAVTHIHLCAANDAKVAADLDG